MNAFNDGWTVKTPKEKYENILNGTYNRDAVYVENKTRKRKLTSRH
jgi:hypothetical protein